MLKRTLAALAAASLLSLAACSDDGDNAADNDENGSSASPTTSESTTTEESSAPSGDTVQCTYESDGQEPAKEASPPPSDAPAKGKVSATIKTSVGDLNAVLDRSKVPCTVNSFVSLAEQDFYDDTPCPRLAAEPGFGMLQCGDPSGTGAGGPGYSYADELTGNETYPAGTIAMANAGPDTNGSQFFLVFTDSQLQPNYTVLGQLDASSIKILQGVGAKGHDGSHPAGGGKPNRAVDIEDVTIR